MISYKILSKSELCKQKLAFSAKRIETLLDCIAKYGDGNVAVCFELSQLFVRVFDGREYFFLYPEIEGLDASDDIDLIAEYAVKEEIGLLFREVPADRLSSLCGRFCYSDLRLEAGDRNTYSVRMRSEADIIGRVPTVKEKEITLSAIKPKDILAYAGVCREESALSLWGYDYREDEPNPSDKYFYDIQRSEFERGVSMTFGVRWRRQLIGEASFYAFDYRGGAEIGFRLLPDYRGMGLGRATLEALFAAAEEIGLDTLYATVDNRNTPSLELLSQYMDKETEENGLTHFVLRGEEI